MPGVAYELLLPVATTLYPLPRGLPYTGRCITALPGLFVSLLGEQLVAGGLGEIRHRVGVGRAFEDAHQLHMPAGLAVETGFARATVRHADAMDDAGAGAAFQ
jgi:hypothetical protein